MEPTSAEILELNLEHSVTAICEWAGFDQLGIKEYFDMLDFELNASIKPRLLAMLSKEQRQKLMEKWTINGEDAKPAIVMTAMLAHKTARLLCGLKDEEPLTGPPPTMTKDGWFPSPPHALVASAQRTIKASSLIDPSDESTIPAATADQVKIWYQNFKELKFGDLLPEKEPTPDQICGMHTRVIKLAQEPYADFSLLTPHGRRMAKVLRHRSWVLQQDGTYQPVDVPGPECWETWKACWNVYEVIMLMLRWPPVDDESEETLVASPIALEAYFTNFATIVNESPGCWHLCQTAEDRRRAERFPRIARRLGNSLGYTPSWSQVFIEAAQDDKYWDKEVRRPALRFLASGTKTTEKNDNPKNLPYAHSDSGGPAKKKQKRKASGSQPPASSKGAGKGKGKGQKKGKQGKDSSLKWETREGKSICFKFAKEGSCEAPCPQGRAHVCQICLQPHRNSNCPRRA